MRPNLQPKIYKSPVVAQQLYHMYATTRYKCVRLKATHKISPLEELVGGRSPPSSSQRLTGMSQDLTIYKNNLYRRGVIVWQLDLQLPMQSVLITTDVVSSNPVHDKVYSMQHNVIKFVCVLRQVCDFLGVYNQVRCLKFPIYEIFLIPGYFGTCRLHCL